MTVALRHPVTAVRADPLKVFELRAWARATLYAACEFDLHEAVDVLQRDAERDGLIEMIGQDGVQRLLRDAFHALRAQS